ncbi:UNVERIFIED_CONTAM: hypothetical protein HDU68_002811 [Siphonaria sp. JEL0065]|nr:hypothetical protein HDU68_002811 [Siphonaria sp. JEL0065]
MVVGVFWDYENCQMPSGAQSCHIVECIRNSIREFGPIHTFNAYASLRQTNLNDDDTRADLSNSGVTLIDCPRDKDAYGKTLKNVADFKIIVDMLFFALDNPPPSVVVLISGDSDFNSALSKLRNRQYTIVLIQAHETTKPVVKTLADKLLHWKLDVLTPKAHNEDLGDEETPPRITDATTSPSGRKNKVRGSLTEVELTNLLEELDQEPDFFKPLIDEFKRVQGLRGGTIQLLRSQVGPGIKEKHPHVYNRMKGCESFGDYAKLAELKGVVVLGGSKGHDWIRLSDNSSKSSE